MHPPVAHWLLPQVSGSTPLLLEPLAPLLILGDPITLSNLESRLEPHSGQSGLVLIFGTRISDCFEQSLHSYSYNGIPYLDLEISVSFNFYTIRLAVARLYYTRQMMSMSSNHPKRTRLDPNGIELRG